MKQHLIPKLTGPYYRVTMEKYGATGRIGSLALTMEEYGATGRVGSLACVARYLPARISDVRG